MNLEKILFEVEKERTKLWFEGFFKDGIIRNFNSMFQNIGNFAKYLPKDYILELFENTLFQKLNKEVAIGQLGSIAEYVSEKKLVSWMNQGICNKKNIKEVALLQLGGVAGYVPEEILVSWFSNSFLKKPFSNKLFSQLGAISKHISDPKILVNWIDSGLKLDFARTAIFSQLGAIAGNVPEDKLIDWVELGLSDNYFRNIILPKQFSTIASNISKTNRKKLGSWLEKFDNIAVLEDFIDDIPSSNIVNYIEKYINSDLNHDRIRGFRHIRFLIGRVSHTDLINLYEKGFKDNSPLIRQEMFKQIRFLIGKIPDSEISSLMEEHNQDCFIDDVTIFKALKPFAIDEKITPRFNYRLEGFLSEMRYDKKKIVNLPLLEGLLPYSELLFFGKQYLKEDSYILKGSKSGENKLFFKHIASLAPYTSLYILNKWIEYGLEHKEESVRKETFGQLELIYKKKISRTRFKNPMINEEYKFILSCLKSKKYTQDKTDDEIITELKALVQDSNRNYEVMTEILRKGKTKNLEEIVECSEFEASKGELFLCKLGSRPSMMGTTYLVYSKVYEKEMAMKIVYDEVISKQERKELGDIEHKNLVRVFGTGDVRRNDNLLNEILMEYVPGKDLYEIMKENPNGLEDKKVLGYGSQLLEGIEYMVSLGKEHRDLHPANIRITPDGVIKVVDFGIVRTIEEENVYDDKYNKRYGGPNDMFSLGLLMYEMCTGKHLIVEKEEDVGTQTFANRVLFMKQIMRRKSGEIKTCYMKLIKDNIPKSLQNTILMSLENVKNNKVGSAIQKLKADITAVIESDKKADLEKSLGYEMSPEKYLEIKSIIER